MPEQIKHVHPWLLSIQMPVTCSSRTCAACSGHSRQPSALCTPTRPQATVCVCVEHLDEPCKRSIDFSVTADCFPLLAKVSALLYMSYQKASRMKWRLRTLGTTSCIKHLEHAAGRKLEYGMRIWKNRRTSQLRRQLRQLHLVALYDSSASFIVIDGTASSQCLYRAEQAGRHGWDKRNTATVQHMRLRHFKKTIAVTREGFPGVCSHANEQCDHLFE
jgi:hypothetical protein